MSQISLVNRINRRLAVSLFRTFSRDWISFEKINRQYKLEYIGSNYGGWHIPINVINENSICYCVGCGEDITFDLGLIERYHCNAYGFDPTPRAIEHVQKVTSNNSKYVFDPIGLWDENSTLKFYQPKDPRHVSHSALNLQKTDEYFEAKVRRLRDIMADNGHELLDLIKIDIEGAEYRVIQSILEDKIGIKILCVEFDEFHNPLDSNFKKRIRECIKGLIEAGYLLINAERDGDYTFIKA